MPRLEITDLVVEYGSAGYTSRPIDHLSLTVEPGSLTLLLGPSGCGKTTLLTCFGAMLTPTSGTIRLGDVDVNSLSGRALTDFRRHSVGFVFQAFNLVPSMSAEENVALPMRAAGVHRGEAHRRALELLETVGLADRAKQRPGDMSGGQQQRVAIARALALDPPLLLADEPTAHLDFVQVDGILALLRELASEDRTVIVSTHDNRLVPLADQVIELVADFATEKRPPQERELRPGEVLFAQGEPSDYVWVVESGRLEVRRRHLDGTEEVLTTVEAGNYVGELGPTLGLTRSATASATEPTKVSGLTVRAFRQRFRGNGWG
jgi:putative ABC transport system ATP-binding protein